MPRDLSALMDTAVASAPPEKYLAGDITRAAERRQRRRTTWVAAGAAAAVVVVAGVTVGLTQHAPSVPEPAHGPYLHDQTVDASNAVPAASLPGYQLVHWPIPSLQDLGKTFRPYRTFGDVDAQGRLLVGHVTQTGIVGVFQLPALRRAGAGTSPPAAAVAGAQRHHQGGVDPVVLR